MKIAPKDAAKVRQLHSELMSVADKYEMSMEDLLDLAVEGEAPEMEDEEEADMEEAPAMGEYEGEEEEKPMDKAKIALIVGKMRRGQME